MPCLQLFSNSALKYYRDEICWIRPWIYYDDKGRTTYKYTRLNGFIHSDSVVPTFHPSLSGSARQSLFKQIPKIEHIVESLENRESAPVDRPLQAMLLQNINGVKPPCLLDNNLGDSLQESLQGHVFYENAECNFFWSPVGLGKAKLLVPIASRPLSSNFRCCCKKQCNLSHMGKVRDLPLSVSRFV